MDKKLKQVRKEEILGTATCQFRYELGQMFIIDKELFVFADLVFMTGLTRPTPLYKGK